MDRLRRKHEKNLELVDSKLENHYKIIKAESLDTTKEKHNLDAFLQTWSFCMDFLRAIESIDAPGIFVDKFEQVVLDFTGKVSNIRDNYSKIMVYFFKNGNAKLSLSYEGKNTATYHGSLEFIKMFLQS